MALRFDPQSLLAARYRDLVDNFRAAQFSHALKAAQTVYAVQRRREDEDYAMVLEIQTARRLDPANAAAARLAGDTESIRQRLIAQYLSKAWTSLGKAAQAPSAADRESWDIDAYQSFDKVLQIDPQNGTATGQMESIKNALDKAAAARVEQVNKLIAAGQFENAGDQIALLAATSRKVGGALDARVAGARYSLDYQWARSLWAPKSYVMAEDKVNDALRIFPTDEALALKRKIADLRPRWSSRLRSIRLSNRSTASSSRGTWPPRRAGSSPSPGERMTRPSWTSWIFAGRKCARTCRRCMPPPSTTTETRTSRTQSSCLRTIVQIDVDYEQAADYLDKANAEREARGAVLKASHGRPFRPSLATAAALGSLALPVTVEARPTFPGWRG